MANTLQLIESIQQVFPNVSRNQIRLDLDSAQKLFADETGTILVKGSLSTPATNVAWDLPTGFVELKEFLMYDADGNPVYLEDLNYKYEIDLDKFYVYTKTSIPLTGLDCTYAYIIYTALPDTLSTESISMDITEHYRDAVESYVLAKYFRKFKIPMVSNGQVVEAFDPRMSQLHSQEYEKLRIKAKRSFNSRIKTDNNPLYYSDPGLYYLPKRINDSTTGTTVSISGIAELYTKYAYYKITSGASGEQAAVLKTGYSTIVCSVTGDVIALESSAEFDEESIILINNWDASWIRNNSSEIVITAPSGWTNISFEIYERD